MFYVSYSGILVVLMVVVVMLVGKGGRVELNGACVPGK